MKKIAVIIVCAFLLAGCQLIGQGPTDQSPSPAVSATGGVGSAMGIYKGSMLDYKYNNYYDFHAVTDCEFTADGKTSPVYKRDLIAKGINLRSNAQYYSHLVENLYETAENNELDWTVWDQYFYADLSNMYMKLNQSWTKHKENDRSLNQYCTKAQAKSFMDMLASRINFGTYVTVNEVTDVTASADGQNIRYTFILDKAKVKTLVQNMLAQKQISEEFTINTCVLYVTADAQSNVIRDEFRANVDATYNGIPGKLDIIDYTEYLAQGAPQLDAPDWITQSKQVTALRP